MLGSPVGEFGPAFASNIGDGRSSELGAGLVALGAEATPSKARALAAAEAAALQAHR